MQGLTLCEISFHRQELVWTTHCTSTLHQLSLLHCESRPFGPANVTADCCFAPSHRRSPVSAKHQDSTRCVELMSDEDRCIFVKHTDTDVTLPIWQFCKISSGLTQSISPQSQLTDDSGCHSNGCPGTSNHYHKTVVLALVTITTTHGAADSVYCRSPSFLTILKRECMHGNTWTCPSVTLANFHQVFSLIW